MYQSICSTGQDLGDKWCSDVKMHFYAGGPEAGIAGIVAAATMLLEILVLTQKSFVQWDFEKMVRQLRVCGTILMLSHDVIP